MGYYEVLELLKKEYKELSDKKKITNNLLEIALSKNDIAKAIGLSIQSVNYSLNKLIKYDEIEYIEHKICKHKKAIPYYYIKTKGEEKDDKHT